MSEARPKAENGDNHPRTTKTHNKADASPKTASATRHKGARATKREVVGGKESKPQLPSARPVTQNRAGMESSAGLRASSVPSCILVTCLRRKADLREKQKELGSPPDRKTMRREQRKADR